MSIVRFPYRQQARTSAAPAPDLRRSAVALTVSIEASIMKHRQRRYFSDDEAFAEYERQRAIYVANEATFEWEYPVPVTDWTARDVDNLIARVLDTLGGLSEPADIPKFSDDVTRAGCVSLKFRRLGVGRECRTVLWISSRKTGYSAVITIPGPPIPATALLGMIESHGEVDVELALRACPGYFPAHADRHRASPQRGQR